MEEARCCAILDEAIEELLTQVVQLHFRHLGMEAGGNETGISFSPSRTR